MNDSKIHIKVGGVEFAGEGNQDWLAVQLDKVLEKIPELLKIEVKNYAVNDPIKNDQGNEFINKENSSLSVLNIAGKLNSKSGTDLVIAASAYLHFTEGKLNFTRDDISSNMKRATGIYKDSFLANLTKTLTRMEKNGSLLKNGNAYCLSANKVSELDALLSK